MKPSYSRFVTERSWLLLHNLEADSGWISEPPASWSSIPAYANLREFLRNMAVVNDCADNQRSAELLNKWTNMERQDGIITVANDHRGGACETKRDGLRNM